MNPKMICNVFLINKEKKLIKMISKKVQFLKKERQNWTCIWARRVWNSKIQMVIKVKRQKIINMMRMIPKRFLPLISIKSTYRELIMRIRAKSMMKVLQHKYLKREVQGCKGLASVSPRRLMHLTTKMRTELILPISQSGKIYGPSKISDLTYYL